MNSQIYDQADAAPTASNVPAAPMRILHIVSSLDETYGGPLRLVLDLSSRSESYGLSSEVLGVGFPSLHDNPLPSSKVHFVPIGFGGPSYAYSSELRHWLRTNVRSFDGVVVHGAWTYPGAAAASVCRKLGVPYAYFPHGMLERWAVDGQGKLKSLKKRLYWKFVERGVCLGARRIFFTTMREKELTVATFPLPAGGTLLRPYGIDVNAESAPLPENPSLRQPDGVNIALFLGRLHPKKNLKLLIEAWGRARIEGTWRLVIAGSGTESYEAELIQLVRDYNLTEHIMFTGFVSGLDKAYLLQRADWFLLPSSQENFGVAVLEAVQHRCAVALSDQVYLTESMRPDSVIIPVEVEAWEKFFRTRMQDLAFMRSVCDLDYSHLLPVFGIDRIVECWVDTLTDVFSPSSKVDSTA